MCYGKNPVSWGKGFPINGMTMRKIMVLNPKGGCGKTTLATNLASYYASQGSKVALADFDPQGSSADWLGVRLPERPPIYQVALDEEKDKLLIPLGMDYVIMDAPAGTHGKELKRHVKKAQTLLIPVLPSPIDIRAAAHFVQELLLVGRVSRAETRIAVVANRVREHTLIYHALQRFLGSLGIPFIATLRDTQNYIRAAQTGVGIFELPAAAAANDLEQWQPLLQWLESELSQPAGKA